MAFVKAIPLYKRLTKKGEPSQALYRLGECYRLTRDYERAQKVYEQVMKWPEKPNEAYFNYGHLLLQQGNYQQAGEMFAEFSRRVPEDERGPAFAQTLNNFQEMFADSAAVSVEILPFNSDAADFSPVPYLDGLVFSSSRDPGKAVVKVYEGTGEFFLDLYFVKETGRKDSAWTTPRPLKGEINTAFHESNFTVANDSATEAWFTRNNFLGHKKGRSEDRMMLLKLYKAQMKGKKGVSVEEFAFNNDNFSLTHPAISQDGNTLYFVSDMPGGFGGKDVYKSQKTGENWGPPENLGSQVNTSGDELFPWISPEGTLYFASNGHPGLGNLDIFAIDLTQSGQRPKNLGYPFNSPFDDFSYLLDAEGESGYFSSNRPGGMGGDDIYRFHLERPVIGMLVQDSISGFPIEGAELVLFSGNGVELETFVTDSVGRVSFKVDRGNFRVQAVTTDFLPYTFPFSTQSEAGTSEFSYTLSLYNPPPAITALVIDEATGKKLPGASVKLVNLTRVDTLARTSDRYGRFSAKLERNSHYDLWVKFPGYLVYKDHISTTFNSYEGDTIIPMKLEPVVINKVMRLENIHYEFDRAEIRAQDYPDLLELVSLLRDNPEIRIELSSHTDARGNAEYNRSLSQRRAESARSFLIRAGVEGNRIVAKGYGESQLLNGCKDGVNCSEDDHFANRRTEFRIIGFVEGTQIEYQNSKPKK